MSQGVRAFGPLLLAAVLAGCVLPPGGGGQVRFYGLEPRMAPPQEADGPVLAVRRVTIPPYLDRQQMVTRGPGPRLTLAETHNWIEPLQAAIARVFAEDLGALLGTSRIYLPEQDLPRRPELELVLDIFAFEPRSDGTVMLDARVRLHRGEALALERRERIRIPLTSPSDYGAMAAAMSEALAELARRTAAALKPPGA